MAESDEVKLPLELAESAEEAVLEDELLSVLTAESLELLWSVEAEEEGVGDAPKALPAACPISGIAFPKSSPRLETTSPRLRAIRSRTVLLPGWDMERLAKEFWAEEWRALTIERQRNKE